MIQLRRALRETCATHARARQLLLRAGVAGIAGLGIALAGGAALAQTGSADNTNSRRPNQLPPHGLAAGDPSYGGEASDTIITARVKAALLGADGVDSNDVHVTTRRGAVTLTGTVPDDAQRDRAASVTQGLDGVVSVTNDLKTGKASQ